MLPSETPSCLATELLLSPLFNLFCIRARRSGVILLTVAMTPVFFHKSLHPLLLKLTQIPSYTIRRYMKSIDYIHLSAQSPMYQVGGNIAKLPVVFTLMGENRHPT